VLGHEAASMNDEHRIAVAVLGPGLGEGVEGALVGVLVKGLG
jgi:hypothetical protein